MHEYNRGSDDGEDEFQKIVNLNKMYLKERQEKESQDLFDADGSILQQLEEKMAENIHKIN